MSCVLSSDIIMISVWCPQEGKVGDDGLMTMGKGRPNDTGVGLQRSPLGHHEALCALSGFCPWQRPAIECGLSGGLAPPHPLGRPLALLFSFMGSGPRIS